MFLVESAAANRAAVRPLASVRSEVNLQILFRGKSSQTDTAVMGLSEEVIRVDVFESCKKMETHSDFVPARHHVSSTLRCAVLRTLQIRQSAVVRNSLTANGDNGVEPLSPTELPSCACRKGLSRGLN